MSSLALPGTFNDIIKLIKSMPNADYNAKKQTQEREKRLAKPIGSLGKLELLTQWLAAWQANYPGRIEKLCITVFAGNHGVAKHNVSAYPPEVTSQMVKNFESGGAAINQLATILQAKLNVIPINLESPVNDFTISSAMDEETCVKAFSIGMGSVIGNEDLICLGEMGIANTTAAAALAAGLFGGDGNKWVGPGTGIDENGICRKQAVVNVGLKTHVKNRGNPLELLRCIGGYEFAAIAGAVVAARLHGVPVVLDGFTCTVAASVIEALRPGALDHCQISHCSAEPGHAILLKILGREALFDFGLRLGEGSGSALGAMIIRAAFLIHSGMATFEEAAVSGPSEYG